MQRKIFYGMLTIFYRLKGFEIAFLVKNIFFPSLVVLMFHRVSNGDAIGLPTITIHKKNFDQLMKLLSKFFNIISQDDLLNTVNNHQPLAPRPMMLTFDDAYEEAYLHASQTLINSQLPATIFPVVNALENQQVFWWDAFYAFLRYGNLKTPMAISFYEIMPDDFKKDFDLILGSPRNNRELHIGQFIERLKVVDLKSINEMTNYLIKSYNRYLRKQGGSIARSMNLKSIMRLEAKGFSIGSHTSTHQFLKNVSAEEVSQELNVSKLKLEKIIGRAINSFAYPSGIYTNDVVHKVKECGYQLAFSTKFGRNAMMNNNLLELKRINIWDGFVCNNEGGFSPSLILWRLLVT